jgi:hypothetical protein
VQRNACDSNPVDSMCDSGIWASGVHVHGACPKAPRYLSLTLTSGIFSCFPVISFSRHWSCAMPPNALNRVLWPQRVMTVMESKPTSAGTTASRCNCAAMQCGQQGSCCDCCPRGVHAHAVPQADASRCRCSAREPHAPCMQGWFLITLGFCQHDPKVLRQKSRLGRSLEPDGSAAALTQYTRMYASSIPVTQTKAR